MNEPLNNQTARKNINNYSWLCRDHAYKWSTF